MPQPCGIRGVEVAARIGLLGLACLAMAFGAATFAIGADATARGVSSALSALTGAAGYAGGLDHPNAAADLRFHAVLWMAYGAVLLRMVADMKRFRGAILIMLMVLFAGGMGRLMALFFDGAPDPFLRVLMWMQLFGPVILGAVLLRASEEAEGRPA